MRTRIVRRWIVLFALAVVGVNVAWPFVGLAAPAQSVQMVEICGPHGLERVAVDGGTGQPPAACAHCFDCCSGGIAALPASAPAARIAFLVARSIELAITHERHLARFALIAAPPRGPPASA